MRQERATSGGRIRRRGPLTFGAGVVMVRPLRRKMLPITARSVTQMYGSLSIPITRLLTTIYSQATAWGLAILQIILHALTVVMALYALFKPGGSFKDDSAEAVQVLTDGQDTDAKIQSNFGPPTKS